MEEEIDVELQLLQNAAEGINQMHIQHNWQQLIQFQDKWISLSVRNRGEPLRMEWTEDGQLVVNRIPDQMNPEKARGDMVRNHVGGFVFKVSDENIVRRFLILGTNGGTYYASEKEHTMENLKSLIEIIEKGNGAMIVREIREISLAGRNPKQDALLFALALCARYRSGDLDEMRKKTKERDAERAQKAAAVKENQPGASDKDPDNDLDVISAYSDYIKELHTAALSIVNDVCRIPTHLFMFVNFCEMVSKNTSKSKSTGWGRGMRICIANWFGSKSPEQLAMHVTKYPQREGWSHRDLFRLAHPVPAKRHIRRSDFEEKQLEYEQLFRYIVKGDLLKRKRKYTAAEKEELGYEPETKYSAVQLDNELNSKALDLVEAALALKNEKDEQKIVQAIHQHKLVREHIPTEMLNSVPIWHALLEKMPMTALIRNLGKLSTIKALDEAHTDKVVNQLTDEAELKKARIHPLNVLLAKTTYDAGRGFKGSLTWDVNSKISEALESAFYKSFINAPPTGKRFCFAFDVSGSMTMSISGTHLSCRVASAALSLISLRNEPHAECVGFCHNLVELPFDKTWDINRICEYVNNLEFGQTDCALPMLWAAEKNKQFDVFVVYTDNETYYGDVHPFEALQQYREKSGITDARLIVMGMTSTRFTIADPTDAGMLDIAGFDSAVPALISEFINGGI